MGDETKGFPDGLANVVTIRMPNLPPMPPTPEPRRPPVLVRWREITVPGWDRRFEVVADLDGIGEVTAAATCVVVGDGTVYVGEIWLTVLPPDLGRRLFLPTDDDQLRALFGDVLLAARDEGT